MRGVLAALRAATLTGPSRLCSYSLAILVKNLFNKLHFKPCHGFCPFGPDGSGKDVEKQFGVQGNSLVMLFGVCIGYTALIIMVGYIALVMQLAARVKRKPPHSTSEAVVLGLPPYALAFALRTPSEAAAPPQRKRGGFLRRQT